MRESDNNAELIANMIQTQRGDHIMFRGFGITATDSLRPPRRSDVAEGAARWYPDARVLGVRVIADDAEKGHFTVAVDVQ
jgi:hypothetical protein